MPEPLHDAAKNGNVAEVVRLVQSGHSLNEKDGVRATPTTRHLTRATPSSQLFCITLMSLRPYEGGASPASGGRDAESLVWNAIGAATKLRRAVPRGLRSQAEGAGLSGPRRGRRPWRRR